MTESIIIVIVIVAIILSIRAVWMYLFTTYTIYDYEQGVKFENGKYSGVVGPGRYTFRNANTRLEIFDMRPVILQINGQDLLSADNVSIKLSIVTNYQINEPHTLLSNYENYHDYLYTNVQLKLREIISSLEIETILSNRKIIKDQLSEFVNSDFSMAGLSIISIDLKDIMLSAELKKAYLEVVKVKKEALASLEKARGEMATLRSLANAAKMLEKNPELMKLRLIQTLEISKGNSFIIDTNHQHTENKA
jgi:regulator of protease activity HflC (stomatin/prohibitin superfamily)